MMKTTMKSSTESECVVYFPIDPIVVLFPPQMHSFDDSNVLLLRGSFLVAQWNKDLYMRA